MLRISAKERKGLRKLRQVLGMASKKLGREIQVAVVGYANTGKSSLISALKGKQSARVSPKPGFTRGAQLIRISKTVVLIDSPGVIPREEDEKTLVVKGSLDVTKVKDPEGAVFQLISRTGLQPIATHYGLGECADEWKLLELLAKKWNFLLKAGEFDTNRAARRLLRHWQKGEIKQ